MRSLRQLAPVAVLLLAPVLAACGGDDGSDDTDDTSPTSSSPESPGASDATSDATDDSTPTDEATEESTEESTEPAGLAAACDVLTAEEVGAAYGVEFGDGEEGGGGTSEGKVEWQSDNCSWEAADLVEIQLAISGPDDFETGFTCPEPTANGSTVTPVSPPGPQAAGSWWEVDDAPPLTATMRVCTAKYLVEIEVGFEDGTDFEGDPQAQTLGLASIVLQKLG